MAVLTELATQYVFENKLAGRTPIYSAARFVRMVGDLQPEEITTEHLATYRSKCVTAKLSAKTIESSIGNLLTLIHATTGRRIEAGKRLRLKRPQPSPVANSQIEAVYAIAPQWLRGWIALTTWTGLRVGDGVRILWEIGGTDPGPVLRIRASKTWKEHVFPMPLWLREILKCSPFPREYCMENTKKFVRAQISVLCAEAGVPAWTPKHLRQRAVTEWTAANATAGAILHGCGLGVMHHYLDPLTVLESAANRVKLPECFGVKRPNEDSLIDAFRRLDPAAQSMLAAMSERLAAG